MAERTLNSILENTALSTVTSPFEAQREISNENLELLIHGGELLLNTLDVIHYDLELIKRKKIVFALDFSEIFTFLWPDKSEPVNRSINSMLFNLDNITFTMPPGCMIELIRHLESEQGHNETQANRVRHLVKQPFVHAFLKALENNGGKLNISEIALGLTEISSFLAETATYNSNLIFRLDRLNTMKNMIPFNNLFDANESEIEPDKAVFRRTLQSLELYRPGKPENNIVDANNYSLIWALSKKHVSQKNTIYYLVTSSPLSAKVFRRFKWTAFPVTSKNPYAPRASLTRHPIHLLYLASIMQGDTNSTKRLNVIRRSLKNLLSSWAGTKEFQDYKRGKSAPTDPVNLPSTKEYTKNFLHFQSSYEHEFAPVRDAIRADIISEENYRMIRHVSPWAVGAQVSGNTIEPSQLISSRILLKQFDALTDLTFRTINKQQRVLGGISRTLISEVDTEGIVLGQKSLVIEKRRNNEFDSSEVDVRSKNARWSYLTADVYKDYFSIVWKTKYSFEEFLGAYKIFNADTKQSGLSDSKSKGIKEKEFKGIYLYALNSDLPVVLNWEDHAELEIRKLFEQTNLQKIKMVRFATEIGDTFYDFQDPEEQVQKIAFMSHTLAPQALAFLVHSSNTKRAPFHEIFKILETELKSFVK